MNAVENDRYVPCAVVWSLPLLLLLLLLLLLPRLRASRV
jgi:hypothetical protein